MAVGSLKLIFYQNHNDSIVCPKIIIIIISFTVSSTEGLTATCAAAFGLS